MPSHTGPASTGLGRPMRQKHFAFDPLYTPLNHGSYGAFPTPVRDHQRYLHDSIEARSDPFIRFRIPELLVQSRAAAASLLGAPVDDVVFVPNTTTAVNTVLRNLMFVEGDTILYFSTAYGACEKTIQCVCETTPANSRCIDVTFPIKDAELERLLRQAIQDEQLQGRNAKIAMFDTVVTFPGVRLPWERLVKTCQELKVLSLIDGAHGIGHIDLTHLPSVGPDFFTSNCYKWLYTPRACAVFYVPLRNQSMIRSTLPTSHGFQPAAQEIDHGLPSAAPDLGRFADLFKWAATVDQTPYLCVPDAIKFRADICGGEDMIRDYCFSLAREGGSVIAQTLGTETMQIPESMLDQCCFTNVRLPLDFHQPNKLHAGSQGDLDPVEGPAVVKWIMDQLMNEYNTWIPGKFYSGAIWVRISAQTYLEMEDFEWAAMVLQKLCGRVSNGEWRS